MKKKILIIVVTAITLMIAKANAQATITLTIDSADNVTPILMGGITDFRVRVRVDNSGSPDSVVGDIFYWYQTDSMMSVAAPPRIFEQDFAIETVYDNFFDTLHIDIQPDELRTGPMNLIVIWPAMINPVILDTDSVVIYRLVTGFAGLPMEPNVPSGNILYPCPAMQYLYIKPDEIEQIHEMIICNMLGEMVEQIPGGNLSNGWINIDRLKPGGYVALLKYKNGTTVSKKFLKE